MEWLSLSLTLVSQLSCEIYGPLGCNLKTATRPLPLETSATVVEFSGQSSTLEPVAFHL